MAHQSRWPAPCLDEKAICSHSGAPNRVQSASGPLQGQHDTPATAVAARPTWSDPPVPSADAARVRFPLILQGRGSDFGTRSEGAGTPEGSTPVCTVSPVILSNLVPALASRSWRLLARRVPSAQTDAPPFAAPAHRPERAPQLHACPGALAGGGPGQSGRVVPWELEGARRQGCTGSRLRRYGCVALKLPPCDCTRT
jgi:hypothetical protein